MADQDQSQGLTTSMPMSAPPTPTPPSPPLGAMDKGVTGADPASDPSQSLMAEATRLGGPLGGIAIGAATGAAHHTESQNQPQGINRRDPIQVRQDPKFLGLDPQSKYDVLMSIDPKFAALQEPDRQSVVNHLSQLGMGAALLSNPEDIGTGPEGTIGTDQLMSQASQADASKKGGTLAGVMTGALAAPATAAAVGGGLAGSIVGGGAAGASSSVIDQLAASENPFRLQMLKQTAADTAMGAATGGVLHAAGKVVEGAFNKAKEMFIPGAAERPQLNLPSQIEQAGNLGPVSEAHFQEIPKTETPQTFPHGQPLVGDQPLNTTDIAALRQGRTLSTDEANLLKQYVGDTVPSGSTVKNTIYGAVRPVHDALDRLGSQMNKLVQSAPAFAQSTIEDAEIGTSLREDLQELRERLPLGPDSDPGNAVITRQYDANNKALVSTDPQEILAARRKLSDYIDWDNIKKNPATQQEVQNTAQARIYQALTDKIKQISGIADLDKEFQPNLELRSWLDKILPEGLTRNPVEADAQRVLEHTKGLRKLAIDAHNERVEQNVKLAEKAIAAHKERIANNWKTAGKVAVGVGLGTGAVKLGEMATHSTP